MSLFFFFFSFPEIILIEEILIGHLVNTLFSSFQPSGERQRGWGGCSSAPEHAAGGQEGARSGNEPTASGTEPGKKVSSEAENERGKDILSWS